jgi:hypothetical protein
LQISKIICNFAADLNQDIIMAQETLKSLIAVIMTLPLQEQEQVIYELQDNVSRNAQKFQPTEEQKARLRKSYLDAQAGRVYSQEDAHRMIDEFAQEQYAVAV